MIDSIPLWFWLPLAVAGWAWLTGLVVLFVRSRSEDPYDELTGLDVLERSGAHPHG